MIAPSDAARALAARRPVQRYSCAVCGQPFAARASTGSRRPRYCSDRCRNAAANARRRGGPVEHPISCAACGAALPQGRRGRVARYCGQRCRRRASRAAARK